MVPVTVIRHPRERRSKCSLAPLEGRPEMTFLRARPGWVFDASGFTLLALDAPLLSREDAGRPLLLPDSTWRLLPQVMDCIGGEPVCRSLPFVRTAYPRTSKIGPDPFGGLASVEALYLAKRLLGERDDGLLDGYHWREAFLEHLEQSAAL